MFLNRPYTETSKDVAIDVRDDTRPPLVRIQTVQEDENATSVIYPCIADSRKFLKNPPTLAAKAAHLVWLSGFPAPEWCNAIGAQYRIDPEFYRRHLNFLPHSRENGDVTIMPSSMDRMITLRVTTMCQRPIALTRAGIEDERLKAASYVLDDQNSVRPGDSVVRKYTVFDHELFALEQDIAIYIERGKQHDGWVGKFFFRIVASILTENKQWYAVTLARI